MEEIRILCQVPFCSEKKGEETSGSVVMRIVVIALGIIVLICGVILHRSLFKLREYDARLNTTMGWTLCTVGSFLMTSGGLIKCVKNDHNHGNREEKHVKNSFMNASSSQKSDEKNIPRETGVHVYVPFKNKPLIASQMNVDSTELTITLTFATHSHVIRIVKEDLFKSRVLRVLVNAANSSLGGGSGINGAVLAHGQEEYAKEYAALGKLYNHRYPEGDAAIIGSGGLRKYNIEDVIIVSGPNLGKLGQPPTEKQKNQLYSCYYNSLLLAERQGKKVIAFPAISTGLFYFPRDEAAKISLQAIIDFFEDYPESCLQLSIHFGSHQKEKVLEDYDAVCQTFA